MSRPLESYFNVILMKILFTGYDLSLFISFGWKINVKIPSDFSTYYTHFLYIFVIKNTNFIHNLQHFINYN